MDELHEQPVARLDRVIVDVPRVWKMGSREFFAGDRPPVGCQGR